MDKRVERTRRTIRETLLSLMGEKPLERITTTELCREAHINRNTFYTHYRAPEAVIGEMEDELLAELDEVIRTGYADDDMTLATCRHIARNQLLYKTLWHCSGSRFLERAVNLFCQQSLDLWRSEGLVDLNDGALFMRFAAMGSLGVIEQWLYDGCRVPCEQIATLIDRFVFLGKQGVSTV